MLRFYHLLARRVKSDRLLGTGEAQTRASGKPSTLMDGAKAMLGAARWLETESLEGETHEGERPVRPQGTSARMNNPHARPPRGSQSTRSSDEAG
jgi:hypothetical protein